MSSLALMGAGPETAGPTFSPSSLANLAGWWKADAGTSTTTDGVAISQWNDQSGNTRHLAQATGTKQPLYKAAIQNGQPVVRFDGTDDFMLFDAGSAFYSGTTLTVCIVHTIRSNASGVTRPLAMTALTGGDFDNNQAFRMLDSSVTQTDVTRSPVTPVAHTPRSANSTFALWTLWWDGVNANLRFNRAAASTPSGASSGSFGIQRVYAAAGQLSGSVDGPGPYDIGEIVFYSADIGGTNRTSLENYLASKWGTP